MSQIESYDERTLQQTEQDHAMGRLDEHLASLPEAPIPEPSDEREWINHNGIMVDAQSGEVIGLAPEQAKFRVTDQASAEWVMERIAEAEGELEALDRRKEVLIENIERMKTPHRQRAAWLRLRFQEELRAWAAKELEGSKRRSIATAWGVLSFRKTQPRIVIEDEDKAVSWGQRFCKAAVQVKRKLLVSEIPEAQRKALLMGSPPDGFRVEPAGEKFGISTGFNNREKE